MGKIKNKLLSERDELIKSIAELDSSTEQLEESLEDEEINEAAGEDFGHFLKGILKAIFGH